MRKKFSIDPILSGKISEDIRPVGPPNGGNPAFPITFPTLLLRISSKKWMDFGHTWNVGDHGLESLESGQKKQTKRPAGKAKDLTFPPAIQSWPSRTHRVRDIQYVGLTGFSLEKRH